MRTLSLWHGCAAVIFCAAASLQAANVTQYSDRTAFLADTSSRTQIDFDTLATGCQGFQDKAGLTVSGVNFNGGVARSVASGPCAPVVSKFQGYAFLTRLVLRADIPAQAYFTATLPAGVMAVGFEAGIDSPQANSVTSRIVISVITSDSDQEQSFTYTGKGTGTGGTRRPEPLFIGFTTSRPILKINFQMPDVIDGSFVLDNFIFGQTAAPTIQTANGVVNGATFQAPIAPYTWTTIFGKLLSGATRPWATEDFNGRKLPTTVEDVSVTFNGKPAYVSYVSPGQVNVLTPSDLPDGPANVVLSRGGLTSAPAMVQVQTLTPALFMFDPENRRYAAMTHVDGTLVGKTSLYPGASTPARPGEVIVLWGTGFGMTQEPIAADEIVSIPSRLVNQAVVRIGGATADVQWAGLVAAGLYQINVKVPESMADGDFPVVVTIMGAQSQQNAYITVQH